MKKFLTMTFAVITTAVCALGVGCKGENDGGTIHVPPSLPPAYGEPIIIEPLQTPTDKDAQAFQEDFLEYCEEKSMPATAEDYLAFHNYMPTEYVVDYQLGAFQVIDKDGQENFYVWYRGDVYCVAPWSNSSVKGVFQHFAIGDWNKDCGLEILVSYNTSKDVSFTYITAIDTVSKQSIRADSFYKECAYFKKESDGNLAIYTSKNMRIENAVTKYSDIRVNKKKYTFADTEYHVTTADYKADIFIDEYTSNFPLIFKGLPLQFKVETKMEWLGETFFYTNSNTYLDGAWVRFCDGENSVYCEGIDAGDALTDFTIMTGMIIECEYIYGDDIDAINPVGTYDMEISYLYSEEERVIEDVLTIAQL